MTYYMICEYQKVKEEFPEFNDVMKALETELISRGRDKWGSRFGGMFPTKGEWGKSPILPALFNGLETAYQPLVTWNQWFEHTGSQTILTGVGTSGTIPKGFMVGLCGLAFLDKALRVSQIKMQISDAKLPRIHLEEALAYNEPAIVFEDYWIIDEQTGFELLGYVLTQGPQRIKPIGLQINKVPNKLQVTNTGASVTS